MFSLYGVITSRTSEGVILLSHGEVGGIDLLCAILRLAVLVVSEAVHPCGIAIAVWHALSMEAFH